MLFNSNPVKVATSSGATAANAGALSRRRHLFQHADDLYWVLLNVSGSTPGVLRSTDGGLTWAVQDSGFGLPSAVNVLPDVFGDTLYFGIESNEILFGDMYKVYRVAKFDLATNTYLSLSGDLTAFSSDPAILHQGGAGGAVAGNGDFHLLLSFVHIDSDFDQGPLAYFVESGGSWSSSYTVLDPDYSRLDRDAVGRRDSAGDLHWFYEHWVTSRTGFAGHFYDDFPHELRHVKEGGSPQTIQTVPAEFTSSFDAFDVILADGTFYLANTRDESYQAVWSSDSDTGASAWTETVVDASSGADHGSFAYDADADVLYIFYSVPTGTIWRATLTAGVWGDLLLVYDPALNPVADGDADTNLDTLNAVRVQGRFGVGAMVRFGGLQRAVYFTGAGGAGAVRSYCF